MAIGPRRPGAHAARDHPLATLIAAWPAAPGLLELRAKPRDPASRIHRAFLDPRATAAIAAWLRRHRDHHVYFGVALRDGQGGGKRNLTAIPALWVDLDQPRVRVRPPVPPPTAIVLTGRGAHLYWALTDAVPVTANTLAAVERVLRGLAAQLGADPAAAEAARTLRAPGTRNWKYDPPAEARLVRCEPGRRYPLSRFAALATPNPVRPAPEPAGERVPERQPPRGAFRRLLAGCGFLRWARDQQAEVREPLWLAALTNVARLPAAERAARLLSERYPGFDEREFRAKLAHARTHRPHSCARIEALGSPACAQCPWRGRLRAPIALAWKSQPRTYGSPRAGLPDRLPPAGATPRPR